jgi:hypothetical protein
VVVSLQKELRKEASSVGRGDPASRPVRKDTTAAVLSQNDARLVIWLIPVQLRLFLFAVLCHVIEWVDAHIREISEFTAPTRAMKEIESSGSI